MSISERQAEIIKVILTKIDTEDKLDVLNEFLTQLTDNNMPCRYSPEERQKRIRKSIEEKEQGDYISHEEMKKRFTA